MINAYISSRVYLGVHVEEVVNALKNFEGDINVLLLASFEDIFRLFDGHFIIDAART